ncbi:MAG TPA: hypothetical protein VL463_08410 [Kofleriaceae bacterium]|jgi:hypothetical protein|nr:hypothetical protein [Kofleriaceae bacterium]
MPRGPGLAAIVAFAACRAAARIEAPPPPADPTRFPHSQHVSLACGECHGVTPPGANDHAPCDRDQCHQREFTQPPGAFCAVCHANVDATGATKSTLKPYPRVDPWRAAPSRFDHATHLDRGKMERAVGFHVACEDCHAQGDAAYPSTATHADCARCHAAEVKLGERAPSMSDCDSCHAAGAVERHPRRLIRGDLQFDHRLHQADAAGGHISCETCHDQTRFAKQRSDHAPPPIAACVGCHDDAGRVPPNQRMRICETCHTERSESLGTLAPRDHLPATELPVDHTLAFRSDHADAAAADPSRCARCHTQLSGNRNGACDECHQTMRPRDHTISFRELDHGSEAAADATRCATCHVADFCTACHTQLPRSHLPRESFLLEHGGQARVNIRACVTCHDPDTSCVRCHPGNAGTSSP